MENIDIAFYILFFINARSYLILLILQILFESLSRIERIRPLLYEQTFITSLQLVFVTQANFS